MNRKPAIGILTALLGLGLSMSSCNGNSGKPEQTPQTTEQEAPQNGPETEASPDPSQQARILDAYLQVKDALVATDAAQAASAAKTLVDALGTSQDDLTDKIRFDAEHIQETQDVGHQRDHFNSLSANVYELVKGAGLERKLYRQYCPMAFDGKGAYWISAEREIMNPYFGDRMLHCGKVEEEI